MSRATMYQGAWQNAYYQGAWQMQSSVGVTPPSGAVYPAGVATFPVVNNYSRFSVGWATKLIREFRAAQWDYGKSLGNFSTLASFLAVARTASGLFWSGGLAHSHFVVTAGEHHAKLHATEHITGSDLLPLASGTSKGLMSSQQAARIAACATSATKNEIAKGYYTGAGVRKFVTCGFLPRYMRVLRMTTVASTGASDLATVFGWRTQQGRPSMREASAIHIKESGTEVWATGQGFYASGEANRTDMTYFYIAVG